MSTPFARIALIATAAAAGAGGQTLVSLPLPHPFAAASLDLVTTFTAPGALAVSEAGRIHRWTGLAASPDHLEIVPPPPLAFAGAWQRLTPVRAVYPAAGPDGAAGTGDEVLAIVDGLPESPAILPTGIPYHPGTWIPVNDAAAVLVDLAIQGFRVLRHDAAGAVEQVIASPVPIDGRGFGRASPDAVLGIGPGPDQVPGNGDDEIVVLRGLLGSSPAVTGYPVPAGSAASAFKVTASGVGVFTALGPSGAVTLTFARDDGTNVTFDTAMSAPPAFGAILGHGFEAGDDAVMTWIDDDLGPGRAWEIIDHVSGAPVAIGSWYDDFNFGCASARLNDRDVLFQCAANATTFTATRFGGAAPVSVTVAGMPDFNFATGAMPRASALAVLTDQTYAPSFSCDVTIVTGLFGANAVASLGAPGAWLHPLVPIGPGMIAAFADLSGTYGATADVLRLVSVPGVEPIGPGLGGGQANPLDLAVSFVSGSGGTTLLTEVFRPAAWTANPLLLGIGTRTTPPGTTAGPPYVALSLLHVDTSSLLDVFMLPFGAGGVSSVVIDAAPVQTLLSGTPFYFQAASLDDAGDAHLSPAHLVVIP